MGTFRGLLPFLRWALITAILRSTGGASPDCPSLPSEPPFIAHKCHWSIANELGCRKWQIDGCTMAERCADQHDDGWVYHKCSFPRPLTCGFRSTFQHNQPCGSPSCQCQPGRYLRGGKCVKSCPSAYLANVEGLNYPRLSTSAYRVAFTARAPNYNRTFTVRLWKNPGFEVYTGDDAAAVGSKAVGKISPEGYFTGNVSYGDGEVFVFGSGEPYIEEDELKTGRLQYHSVVYNAKDVKGFPALYDALDPGGSEPDDPVLAQESAGEGNSDGSILVLLVDGRVDHLHYNVMKDIHGDQLAREKTITEFDLLLNTTNTVNAQRGVPVRLMRGTVVIYEGCDAAQIASNPFCRLGDDESSGSFAKMADEDAHGASRPIIYIAHRLWAAASAGNTGTIGFIRAGKNLCTPGAYAAVTTRPREGRDLVRSPSEVGLILAHEFSHLMDYEHDGADRCPGDDKGIFLTSAARAVPGTGEEGPNNAMLSPCAAAANTIYIKRALSVAQGHNCVGKGVATQQQDGGRAQREELGGD